MTTEHRITPPPPRRRRAHTAVVHPVERIRRRQVARWAIRRGLPVERDALAALVGAAAARAGRPPFDGHRERWTEADVGALLRTGVDDWCRDRGVAPPEPGATAATLRTYLEFLAGCGLLSRDSHSPTELRRAVGNARARRSPHHPALARGRLAPVVPIS